MYIHKPQRQLNDMRNIDNDYIVLDNLDFSWDKTDVKYIIYLVNEKEATLEQLAEKYRRHPEEVFLLLLDLARDGRIKPKYNVFHLEEVGEDETRTKS